jgi:hypothetical protein
MNLQTPCFRTAAGAASYSLATFGVADSGGFATAASLLGCLAFNLEFAATRNAEQGAFGRSTHTVPARGPFRSH